MWISPVDAASSPPATIDQYLYAGFWPRVPAWLLDTLVIVLAMAAFDMAYLSWSGHPIEAAFTSKAAGTSVAIHYNPTMPALLFGLFVSALYYVGFESSRHQATLGKMTMKLVVADEDGQHLTRMRAFGRWAGHWLSCIVAFVGFFLAGWTSRKQALHDLLARCLVLKRIDQPIRADMTLAGN